MLEISSEGIFRPYLICFQLDGRDQSHVRPVSMKLQPADD